eukprot:SAG31_NODE_843_length_11551_cov_6.757772_14_plen_457_part_00
MPGEADRGGAAPRRGRATGANSTGVRTRRASRVSAQVPAPETEPDWEQVGGENSDGDQPRILAAQAVGATAHSSTSEDEYTTAQQDTPLRAEAVPVERAAAVPSNSEAGAGVVAEEPPAAEVESRDRAQVRIEESEREEVENLRRARDAVQQRRRRETQGEPDNRRTGRQWFDRHGELDAILDSDDEYEDPRSPAGGGRPNRRRYQQGESEWGTFSSEDEEGEPDEPAGVPYFPSGRLVRPDRLFRQQDFGRIEQVNLFRTGEYASVIPGFKDLTPACQYEVEYTYPVTGRLHDILRELVSVERAEPGRIPGYIAAELRRCYDLLEERVDGQMERAKCASGQSSEGFTLDATLAIMLELRDARMEAGSFREGAFGKAKLETAKRVRLARAKLRASRQALQAEGGGKKWTSKWKRKPQNAESQSEATESEGEKGAAASKGSQGKGKSKGGRGGGRTS